MLSVLDGWEYLERRKSHAMRLFYKYEYPAYTIIRITHSKNSCFEALLRWTAQQCGVEFASIRGVANLDIMIPGELEKRLRRRRKQPVGNYLAECNPRWTNYTDAIMTILGANRR